MDLLLIIGFVIFSVLKALDEANKKKQEQEGKVTNIPKEIGKTKSLKDIFSEDFPPIVSLPWQEVQEDDIFTEGFWEDEAEIFEDFRTEEPVEDDLDVFQTVESKKESYQEPQFAPSADLTVSSSKYNLQLRDEQVWQGIVWSEILQPPRCRRIWPN